MTSRPYLPIRLGFKSMSSLEYEDVVLQELPRPVIPNDILTYLTYKLRKVREDYNLDADEDILGQMLAGFNSLQNLPFRCSLWQPPCVALYVARQT